MHAGGYTAGMGNKFYSVMFLICIATCYIQKKLQFAYFKNCKTI